MTHSTIARNVSLWPLSALATMEGHPWPNSLTEGTQSNRPQSGPVMRLAARRNLQQQPPKSPLGQTVHPHHPREST